MPFSYDVEAIDDVTQTLPAGESAVAAVEIPAPEAPGEHTLVLGFGRFENETDFNTIFTGELISNAIRVSVAPPRPESGRNEAP